MIVTPSTFYPGNAQGQGQAHEDAPNGIGLPDGGPLRVLFVQDHLGYASGTVHGATTYLQTTLPAFDPRRIESLLCILGARHPAARRLEAAGIRPIFLEGSKWDLRVVGRLASLVRDAASDVLHLSGHKSITVGRLVARLTGRPAVIHLHDTDPLEPLLRCFRGRMARWTSKALAVSEPVRRAAIQHFALPADLVEVLPNPLQFEPLAQITSKARERARDALALPRDAAVLGVIGRLVPGKGHARLIEVLPAIRHRCARAVLLIAGEGPKRRRCEHLIERLRLSGAVRFIGHREDIPDVLAALDLLVVPSIVPEGFCYSALEASAAGLPVVAFASGALPLVVIHGHTGLLVPPGDVNALAAAICRVLEDQALAARLGRAGQLHARRFTPQIHVRRLEQIYAHALGRR